MWKNQTKDKWKFSAMLVCKRWREIGDTQRLWSSLPVIVNTRNMAVIPKILSNWRMQGLKKLRIQTKLSKKVPPNFLIGHREIANMTFVSSPYKEVA